MLQRRFVRLVGANQLFVSHVLVAGLQRTRRDGIVANLLGATGLVRGEGGGAGDTGIADLTVQTDFHQGRIQGVGNTRSQTNVADRINQLLGVDRNGRNRSTSRTLAVHAQHRLHAGLHAGANSLCRVVRIPVSRLSRTVCLLTEVQGLKHDQLVVLGHSTGRNLEGHEVVLGKGRFGRLEGFRGHLDTGGLVLSLVPQFANDHVGFPNLHIGEGHGVLDRRLSVSNDQTTVALSPGLSGELRSPDGLRVIVDVVVNQEFFTILQNGLEGHDLLAEDNPSRNLELNLKESSTARIDVVAGTRTDLDGGFHQRAISQLHSVAGRLVLQLTLQGVVLGRIQTGVIHPVGDDHITGVVHYLVTVSRISGGGVQRAERHGLFR